MNPVYIIITAPHACCKEGYNCDETAEINADFIFESINIKQTQKKKFINKDKIKKCIPRDDCDYNRYYCKSVSISKNSRKMDYRKEITQTIKNKIKQGYRIFLLDVHSYNPNYLKEESNIEELKCFILDNNYRKFTIIENFVEKKEKTSFSYVSNHFYNYMKKKKTKINLYQGKKGYNDIMDEANEFGIENFLIEFNDLNSTSENKLIAINLVNWINYYFINPKIVSPIYGTIKYIDKEKIGVYIDINDIHNIYVPKNGDITSIKTENGFFTVTGFKSDELKRGKLIIEINGFKFEVLVGAGYVTNNIKFNNEKNKNLKIGEYFGEIIINKHNSYAYLYISNENFKLGTKLRGGMSTLN